MTDNVRKPHKHNWLDITEEFAAASQGMKRVASVVVRLLINDDCLTQI